MFQAVSDIGRVAVRLVHFGGNHMSDHGWNSNAAGLAAAMAAVRCQSGLTQIIPSLQCFVDGDRAEAVILVGDAFEEEAVEAFQLLPFLNAAGTRIFAFFEGDNRAAEAVFRRLAEETGGRFARLGENCRSAICARALPCSRPAAAAPSISSRTTRPASCCWAARLAELKRRILMPGKPTMRPDAPSAERQRQRKARPKCPSALAARARSGFQAGRRLERTARSG